MRLALAQIILLLSAGWLAAYVAQAVKARHIASMLRMIAILASIAIAARWISEAGLAINRFLGR